MEVKTYAEANRLSRSGRKKSSGAFSRVVPDPDDPAVVHKIGYRNDPAYRAFVEQIALPLQKSPAVPRIFDYKTWPIRGRLSGELHHYVKMEALQPVEDAPHEVRQRAVDLLVLTDDGHTIEQAAREYPHPWFRSAWRPVKTRSSLKRRVAKEQPHVVKALTSINRVIRAANEGGEYMSNDMHYKNIMWRPSTDDIVITDPLYS